ncbi:hypothetical protein GYMLUDRAFT_162721, partial [Collybiopsis luxurians FD-317 M1]
QMIIDEKWMHPPPPPYPPPPFFFSEAAAESGSSGHNGVLTEPTFSNLPAHLLLQIVYSTFPQTDGRYEGEGKIERQRRNLYWLETSLRLVNKALYTGKYQYSFHNSVPILALACMHILRSTYLPAYDSLIRPPYTSDPFSSSILPGSTSDSGPVHRELITLDLFIALLAHEDLLLDATSLHLPREEAYKDLFDMVQPRSRLEDIVLEEGVKAGVIYMRRASHSSPPSPSTPGPSYRTNDSENTIHTPPVSPIGKTASSSSTKHRVKPLPFEALSVSFSPRRVALVYTPTKKILVEIGRGRDESLEATAKSLIEGLKEVLVSGCV